MYRLFLLYIQLNYMKRPQKPTWQLKKREPKREKKVYLAIYSLFGLIKPTVPEPQAISKKPGSMGAGGNKPAHRQKGISFSLLDQSY